MLNCSIVGCGNCISEVLNHDTEALAEWFVAEPETWENLAREGMHTRIVLCPKCRVEVFHLVIEQRNLQEKNREN